MEKKKDHKVEGGKEQCNIILPEDADGEIGFYGRPSFLQTKQIFGSGI